MPDGSITKLVIMLVCLVFSGFFSASETAFTSANHTKLKNLSSEGNKRASLVLKMVDNYDKLLSTILVGNNIVNITLSSVATILFIDLLTDTSWLSAASAISTVVVTVVVLIFGEITPKSLAKESPESFAMFSAPLITLFTWILMPLNLLFMGWKKFVFLFFKPKAEKGDTEDELLTIVEEAETEGELESNEVELIRNAIEFNDIDVVDILQPRVKVEAFAIDATWDEIDGLFRSTGYSRLPVYRETIDDIYGVVNQKDFYMAKEKNIEALIKPIDFVVPAMKISELLVQLQKNKSHMAAVVDEYGGIAGIVTLEDIIEELVGEIWDEHDEVVEEFVEIGEKEYRVKCEAALDDLFEIADINEELDIPTVGGWVIDELKHLPEEGETFEYQNLFVTVSKCDDRHVLEIVVKVVDPEEAEEDEKDEDQSE